MKLLRLLVPVWLLLDFFGEARRTGSPGSSLTTTIFTQSFLALVVAALMYPETPPVPFAAANLCLSTLLVATGLLGVEGTVQQRAADRLLLATAPVPRLQIALARAAHAAFYVALVTIGMALPPAILLGLWTNSALTGLAYVLLACACSGLVAGGLSVATRLASRWLGDGGAALLAGTGKAILLGGGVVLFALGLRSLQGTADELPIGRLGAELLLPYHAARLLAYPGEFWRALVFVGVAILLLLAATLLGDSAGNASLRQRRWRPLDALLRRLAGRGPRLGIAAFTATAMWRSPGFRARVLPLLGLPAGMAYLSLQGGQPNQYVFACLLLQLPAIYLPFLIAFLPRADQPGTDWVFAQAPPVATALLRDAVWRALVSHVLVPVHLLAMLLIAGASKQPLDHLAASLFALGLAVLAARPMLNALSDTPFTEHRDEGAATDLGGLFTYSILLAAIGVGFGALLVGWQRWLVAAGTLLAAATALRLGLGASTVAANHRESTAEPEASAHPVPAAASSPKTAAPQSLARELRAIAVLYVACSLLPLALGLLFGD